jgi:hypothetical protein
LFWIASQTKPVTASALMMLAEEGKLRLDDPVEVYSPVQGIVTGMIAPVKMRVGERREAISKGTAATGQLQLEESAFESETVQYLTKAGPADPDAYQEVAGGFQDRYPLQNRPIIARGFAILKSAGRPAWRFSPRNLPIWPRS